MKRLFISLLLFASLWFVSPALAAPAAAPAAGEGITVDAQGEAAILSGDKAQAKDKAMADAFRNAVEKAVGTFVTSDSQTKDFELVSDRVLTHSKGYIKTFDVVKQSDDGQTVTVEIKAVVGKDSLEKDVDALLRLIHQKGKPKILIMVAEQNIGQPDAQAWWSTQGFTTNLDVVENTFIEKWAPEGFSFVDPQALRGKIKVSKALASPNVDDGEAKTFAGKAGAQVVIVGKAIAQEANGKAFGTNLISARANMSVRAIRTDTGDILATSTIDGGSMALDTTTAGTNALKETAKKMADDLKSKIMHKWLQEVNEGQGIKLTVNNIKQSKDLRTLKNALTSSIRGVTAVRDRGFKNHSAEFEVEMRGTPQDLAIELESKKFGGFAVNVDEVSENTLELTLK